MNKNIFITWKGKEEVILILKRIKMIQKSLLLHPQNRIQEKVFNNGLGTKTTTGVTQSQQRVRSKAKYVFLQILYFSLRLCGFFCDNKLKTKISRNCSKKKAQQQKIVSPHILSFPDWCHCLSYIQTQKVGIILFYLKKRRIGFSSSLWHEQKVC